MLKMPDCKRVFPLLPEPTSNQCMATAEGRILLHSLITRISPFLEESKYSCFYIERPEQRFPYHLEHQRFSLGKWLVALHCFQLNMLHQCFQIDLGVFYFFIHNSVISIQLDRHKCIYYFLSQKASQDILDAHGSMLLVKPTLN